MRTTKFDIVSCIILSEYIYIYIYIYIHSFTKTLQFQDIYDIYICLLFSHQKGETGGMFISR